MVVSVVAAEEEKIEEQTKVPSTRSNNSKSNSPSKKLAVNDVKKMTTDEWKDRQDPTTIVLFDVDGTLTESRKPVTSEVMSLLAELKKKTVIGYVGGSDLSKQVEQLGETAVTGFFDFGFSENGATAFRLGKQIGKESILGFLGEEKYQKLVNWILRYIADLEIPIKRGTFVELRNAMVNVSPIGRNCTYEERLAFAKLDESKCIRATMVEALKKEFADYNLQFSIGGQISIDIFPIGWDKTFCLKHLQEEGFKTIHFFGDKTAKGGNDYEIFSDPHVTGHTVTNPEDTIAQLKTIFNL